MAPFSRVFIGAPTAQDLAQTPSSYHWQTVSSSPPRAIPQVTLEEASRRISLLYHNIIFREADEADLEDSDTSRHNSARNSIQDDTTHAITWDPTAADGTASASQLASRTGDSFLRASASLSRGRSQPQQETQETQETASYAYSDASSIAHFPAFHFSLHQITALSALAAQAQATGPGIPQKGSRKVTILAALLEVEGPDTIRIKKGREAGKEVSLLKLILGDDDGVVCRLTAWREVAETWGGAHPDVSLPGVKRGDVVLLENVLAAWEPDTRDAAAAAGAPFTLTASPHLSSALALCYRALPAQPADTRFRPDLRLGQSEPAVRRVGALVRWFERMAGL